MLNISALGGRSKALLNLIDQMLTVQPTLRASAVEVKGHSWMRAELDHITGVDLEPTVAECNKVRESRFQLKVMLDKQKERKRRRDFSEDKSASSGITSPQSKTRVIKAGTTSKVSPQSKGTALSHASPIQPTTNSSQGGLTKSEKPLCKYGVGCYRKNKEHLRQFSHNF